MKKYFFLAGPLLFALTLFSSPPANAGDKAMLSKGQDIYVPTYSHIYHGDRERPFLLTVTLSIRNIDPNHSIKVTTVDYYETQGKLLRQFLKKSVTLKPLESIRYIIPETDKSGGSGANFIVTWQSEKAVNPPIVESVMIGTLYQQGLSFTSRGRVLYSSE